MSKGETSQQKSQQGLGVEGAGSSNVIPGGPEIIVGSIEQINGDEYSVKGDRGQSLKLRLTKDTNVVCAGGEGAKMSTVRQDMKERQEIPIASALSLAGSGDELAEIGGKDDRTRKRDAGARSV